MSPKAWKASFSEFQRSYSSRSSLRSSFRSPDKPRHSSLSRESSTLGFSSRSSTLERTLTESRELDTASCNLENQSSEEQEEAVVGTSGEEQKEDDGGSSQVEEEKSSKVEEDKKDHEKAPPSESSSELNNSYESESLDQQLSGAHSETLHIEEEDDTPATLESQKANGLKNGDVSGLNSDTKHLNIPHKVCLLITSQLSPSGSIYGLF